MACSAMLSGASGLIIRRLHRHPDIFGRYGRRHSCYDRQTHFASDASLGETFACRIEGLEPRQIYCLAIVGRSPSGVPSRPAVISVRTGENTPPEATASIPNLFLQSDDKAGRSIDLQLYFADADAPGDRLSYFVSPSAEKVVECRVQDSELLVRPCARAARR